MPPIIPKETWNCIFANIRADTYEPYQEEVSHEDMLDLPYSEVIEADTGPMYSIDDPYSEW